MSQHISYNSSSRNVDERFSHKDPGKYNSLRHSKTGHSSHKPVARTSQNPPSGHHDHVNSSDHGQTHDVRRHESSFTNSDSNFQRYHREPPIAVSRRSSSKLPEETVETRKMPAEHTDSHSFKSLNKGLGTVPSYSKYHYRKESLVPDSRHSSAQSYKSTSNSKYSASENNKHSKDNILRENHSYVSPSMEETNGFADHNSAVSNCHSDTVNLQRDSSSSFFGTHHAHSETNHSHSKETSRHDGKKFSSEHEEPNKSHRTVHHHPKSKVPNHGQDSLEARERSPGKCHPDSFYSSPRKRGPPSASQGHSLSAYESPCRPDAPSSSLSEYSNDDRFFGDESKYLMIDTAESSGLTKADQSPVAVSPYSIALREGMFTCRKIGRSDFSMRVIKPCGPWSWGWTMKKTTYREGPPSSSSSSANRKVSSTVSRDRCKRKIEYCKDDPSAPNPKKVTPSKDQDCSKYKESAAITNGWDADSNKYRSQKMAPEEKDARKTSQSRAAGKPNHQHSKKQYPVPHSQGNSQIPKVDCDMKNSQNIDNATMAFITSKKDRRSIYSGKKSVHDIPTLKDTCLDYIKKNILNIRVCESFPFERLLPILEQCGPSKLHKFEKQNKHLLKYTDELWHKFCIRDFREEISNEGVPWKDVFWRARMKQEDKLKSLTARLSNGIAKAQPERQAKFIVDSHDPEKRMKKNKKPEDKLELNGRRCGSALSDSDSPSSPKSQKEKMICPKSKSSESESSDSPKLMTQKSCKTTKFSKRTVAPLMSKAKKMVSLVSRRR